MLNSPVDDRNYGRSLLSFRSLIPYISNHAPCDKGLVLHGNKIDVLLKYEYVRGVAYFLRVIWRFPLVGTFFKFYPRDDKSHKWFYIFPYWDLVVYYYKWNNNKSNYDTENSYRRALDKQLAYTPCRK